jgi:16S rRNA (uracil1498-N3)-methyltransferase
MSKVRVYYPDLITKEPYFNLDNKGQLHRLKHVMRLEPGDTIFIFNGRGQEFEYVISNYGKKEIILKKIGLSQQQSPPRREIALAFPLMQEDKVNFILQKGTEIGINHFIPFVSGRTQIKQISAKLRRWQKIVIAATRQSQRLWLPDIIEPLAFSQLSNVDYQCKFFGDIDGYNWYKTFKGIKENKILLAIGPAGDFTDSEKQQLLDKGFNKVRIGSHLLRSETAAIVISALLTGVLDEG